MFHLDLSQREAEILSSILDFALSELRMEIAATDRMAFRDALKEREDVINKVLSALPQPDGRTTS